MIRLLLLLVLISANQKAFCQAIVSGNVFNSDTHTPIAFANIGLPGSSIGTISNEDGSFSLPVPLKSLNDSLSFSALGFGQRKIAIAYFLDDQKRTVWLNEKIYALKEVSIYAKSKKNKFFRAGNRSHKGGVLEADTTYAGRALALFIDPALNSNMPLPVYIQKASLRILRNNLPSFRFRLRLNKVDSVTGAPGEDILDKSIVVISSVRQGWVDFDLSEVHLLIDKPFFITFEQITNVTDRAKIAEGYRKYIYEHPEKLKTDTIDFDGEKQVTQVLKGGIDLPGTFIAISKSDKYVCYERKASFDTWQKTPAIVTASVTFSNQPVASSNIDTSKCESSVCRIQEICQNFLDESGMNGMQLCIIEDGVKNISLNLGLSEVKTRRPVTSETMFRINSISKSLTAAALVKLAEDDKIDFDAPVQKYLCDFPNINTPFTTRQLAGHLAGFRDYNEEDLTDFVRHKHYPTSVEALEIIKDDTLLYKPGSRFHYSTFGWILIGAVIEKVSHENYGDVMEKLIFNPLHLKNTCLDDIEKTIPNRSKFYDAAGNENDYGDWSYKYAGAGLLSTAEDLAAFGNELLNGSYFNADMRNFLFKSQSIDGKETGYGLGWYTGVDRKGNKIWHHSGDSFSSSSHLIIYPEHNLILSFLGNSQDGAAFDWEQIAHIALEGK